MEHLKSYELTSPELIFGGEIYGTTATIYGEYYTDVYDSDTGNIRFKPAF
ncbi:hypothetical protein [uncultured Psychroserpens sp.]|nr:hypothetical protein [uncultured Psychroserpens sp.]